MQNERLIIQTEYKIMHTTVSFSSFEIIFACLQTRTMTELTARLTASMESYGFNR